MVDNLTTHDYHEIRENLGLTSGSHSIGIRHHMFTHLYEQLWDEVALVGDKRGPTWDLLVTQLLFFRSFIFQWRDEHLHLPRNNLGGAATRSLTGSSDAVSVVEGMSDHARTGDPANAYISDGATPAQPERGPLASYLRTDESLDTALLTATGLVTQSKFRERAGEDRLLRQQVLLLKAPSAARLSGVEHRPRTRAIGAQGSAPRSRGR